MVRSILQYLLVLHSPNLHQLFFLTDLLMPDGGLCPSESAKVTRPSVFTGKISVGLVKKIHTQDHLSGEKIQILSISKHSSLVKLGVVWLIM